jgi:hypothetical protein
MVGQVLRQRVLVLGDKDSTVALCPRKNGPVVSTQRQIGVIANSNGID